MASSYGAAGSIVLLVIWVYYSCAIIFYGVEFIRAYRVMDRRPVEPKKTAVLVHEEFVGVKIAAAKHSSEKVMRN